MGMFDDIQSDYRLPLEEFQDETFQTKDMECELAKYKIRRDGTLWVRGGWDGVKSWSQVKNFTGEIRFYTTIGETSRVKKVKCGWIEFSSYFVAGKIKELNLITHRQPEAWEPVESP